MTEQKNTGAEKLKAFLTTKNTKTNTAMQQAQKMVNLFRSVEDFGDDFIDQYNNELLQISNDAELMLNALVGGSEVRQYLDYLRNASKTQDDNTSDQQTNAFRGYLPGPENDIQTSSSSEIKSDIKYVTMEDFEKFKSEQMELISRLMHDKRTADNSPTEPTSASAQTHPSMDYAEIIEEKQPGSDAIAGFKDRRDE